MLYATLACGDIMKKQLRGTALLLLTTIIWGSAFVSQSVGMDHIQPATFQAVRCMLAVIGLMPVIFISDRIHKSEKTFLQGWADKKLWKAGILCGIPLFLACNLQQFGLVDTDAGKTGFLTSMYIVIVPVIGIFLKRKPTIMVPISVAIAVAGLYCMSCVGVTNIQASDLLIIACAFMFALQIIFVDLFAMDVDALRLNAIQALICSVLSAIIMVFTETPTWSAISGCAIPLAHAGFLSMGAAYALQIMGQRDLQPSTASILMSLEAVFAAIFGALILRERMSSWELLGCGLMFLAVILSMVPVKSKKEKVHS